MLTLFAVVVALLLWWVGSSAYAIAIRGDSTQSEKPNDGLLSWRVVWILGKRPDWFGSKEDWQKWHDQYKGKLDTEYFMPEWFTPRDSK